MFIWENLVFHCLLTRSVCSLIKYHGFSTSTHTIDKWNSTMRFERKFQNLARKKKEEKTFSLEYLRSYHVFYYIELENRLKKKNQVKALYERERELNLRTNLPSSLAYILCADGYTSAALQRARARETLACRQTHIVRLCECIYRRETSRYYL